MQIDWSSRYGSAIDRSIVAGRQTVVVLRNRPPPVRSAQPTRPVRQVARQTPSLHKRIYRARHVTVGRTNMVLIIIVSTNTDIRGYDWNGCTAILALYYNTQLSSAHCKARIVVIITKTIIDDFWEKILFHFII